MPDDQSTMYKDGGIEEREKGSMFLSQLRMNLIEVNQAHRYSFMVILCLAWFHKSQSL